MKNVRASVRLAGLFALGLVTIVAMVRTSKASIGNVSKSDLAGPWQM